MAHGMDYQLPKRQKFGIVEGENERAYHYPPSYFRETLNDGSERLLLAGDYLALTAAD